MTTKKTTRSVAMVTKQDRVISALLRHSTIAAAADECGVSDRTVRRWLHGDSEFQERLARMRREMIGLSFSRIQGAMPKAAEVLAATLDAGDMVSPATRVAAAKTVMAIGLALHKTDMWRVIVSALERKLPNDQRSERAQAARDIVELISKNDPTVYVHVDEDGTPDVSPIRVA